MSLKKTIQSEMDIVYNGFNILSSRVCGKLDEFSDKLDAKETPRYQRVIIAVRNWLTHFLLWILLALLLSSCFVSGRSITLATPKVEITADTATAYTWPYNTKFQ